MSATLNPLAHEHVQNALALLVEAQDHYGRAGAVAAIADAVGHLGDHERAAALWRDSLRQWHDMGNVMYGPVGVAGIASALQRQGQHDEAALLFGAVALQMPPERVGAVEWAFAEMCHESVSDALGAARSEAGSSAAARAWKEDERKSLEEAIACALREDVAPKSVTALSTA